ncbi:hypothetical protein [Streptomyces griseosporeus]|uniref:hypothetical protein n=1 Tax=Streptomyces griseosporeus TaxID=1910 RepID=UPI0036FB6443
MEVVHHFIDRGSPKDGEEILAGMAQQSVDRLIIALRDPRASEFKDAALEAVPWNKRSDYATALRNEGFHSEADTVHQPYYSDEPPF